MVGIDFREDYCEIFYKLAKYYFNFSFLKAPRFRDCAHSIVWDPILFFRMHEYSREMVRRQTAASNESPR